MVVLNYPPPKTVESALQVRVAQIDRIEAQLPQPNVIVVRYNAKVLSLLTTLATRSIFITNIS
jgi:hypothetical protein